MLMTLPDLRRILQAMGSGKRIGASSEAGASCSECTALPSLASLSGHPSRTSQSLLLIPHAAYLLATATLLRIVPLRGWTMLLFLNSGGNSRSHHDDDASVSRSLALGSYTAVHSSLTRSASSKLVVCVQSAVLSRRQRLVNAGNTYFPHPFEHHDFHNVAHAKGSFERDYTGNHSTT